MAGSEKAPLGPAGDPGPAILQDFERLSLRVQPDELMRNCGDMTAACDLPPSAVPVIRQGSWG
ncbi:hypothetical protein GCM10009107_64020 [Ideonella azotifigens]|uniref:Uncharacterized protein n=1 Tax=Ideonella azotifigens TaxID=513160 RepID=A0ABP3VXZ0_9BURK